MSCKNLVSQILPFNLEHFAVETHGGKTQRFQGTPNSLLMENVTESLVLSKTGRKNFGLTRGTVASTTGQQSIPTDSNTFSFFFQKTTPCLVAKWISSPTAMWSYICIVQLSDFFVITVAVPCLAVDASLYFQKESASLSANEWMQATAQWDFLPEVTSRLKVSAWRWPYKWGMFETWPLNSPL